MSLKILRIVKIELDSIPDSKFTQGQLYIIVLQLSDVEGHMIELEAELQEARRRSQHYYHALSSVRDLIGQLGTEGAVVTSDLLKQIKYWLEHIESIEGVHIIAT